MTRGQGVQLVIRQARAHWPPIAPGLMRESRPEEAMTFFPLVFCFCSNGWMTPSTHITYSDLHDLRELQGG